MKSSDAYVDERVKRGHLFLALRSFGPPSGALVDYHLKRGGIPLHDAVGVNYKRGATNENQGAGAWYLD